LRPNCKNKRGLNFEALLRVQKWKDRCTTDSDKYMPSNLILFYAAIFLLLNFSIIYWLSLVPSLSLSIHNHQLDDKTSDTFFKTDLLQLNSRSFYRPMLSESLWGVTKVVGYYWEGELFKVKQLKWVVWANGNWYQWKWVGL